MPSRKRAQRWLIGASALALLVGPGVGLGVASAGGGSGKLASPGRLGPPGPEGPPIEAGANLTAAGAPPPGGSVDGIQCGSTEQVAFHIHARLTLYVGGKSMKVPAGVGIADPQLERTPRGAFVGGGACFAWLHTHAADGVVHIESPVQRTYTLANFFDVWGQPLSRTRVGPARGRVTAWLNGKRWRGRPTTWRAPACT